MARKVPIISQTRALLPDGAVDPDSVTDCGEACLAAVFRAYDRLPLSPGCIRQALDLSSGDGRTTASDLVRALKGVGLEAQPSGLDVGRGHGELSNRLATGQVAIALGRWIDPAIEHWVVVYHVGAKGIWVMDPWDATYVQYDWSFVHERQAGVVVFTWVGARPRASR